MTERGVTSVQFLLAAGLALVMFLALANLVAVQYGRGAIRSALEQGARAGTISRSVGDCVATVDDVVGQLLGGRMSDQLNVNCIIRGELMVVQATAVFESWTPLTPDFVVNLESTATLEALP